MLRSPVLEAFAEYCEAFITYNKARDAHDRARSQTDTKARMLDKAAAEIAWRVARTALDSAILRDAHYA